MTEDDTTHDGQATSRRRVLAGGAAAVGALALPAAGVLGSTGQQGPRTFQVRIENVSDGSTLGTTADGEMSEQPVPLSPGAFAVHAPDEPIFTPGEPERDNGLEEVAEDGMPGRLVESLKARESVVQAGAFTTPAGADAPGPLTPGNAYEFTVRADPGSPAAYLSLATMFVPSNDLFYALGGATGLRLFADGEPVHGDVTDEVALWDAGTEVNEEPGVGEHQVQRQRGANVGLVERGTVAPVDEVNGYDYPAAADVIKVTLSGPGEGN